MACERQAADISTPGTKRMPLARAPRSASSKPAMVSWSVSANTSTPAAAARSTSSAGRKAPSEQVEWVCKSMLSKPHRLQLIARQHDEALSAFETVVGVVERIGAQQTSLAFGVAV